MTEPREPEAVPEGEVAQEEQPTTPASPSTGSWYPVSAQPEPESPLTVESVTAPEPVEVPASGSEPAMEPVAESEPVEPAQAVEAAVEPVVQPEPVVAPAAEPMVEPEPVLEVSAGEVAAEVDDPETAVAIDPEPAAEQASLSSVTVDEAEPWLADGVTTAAETEPEPVVEPAMAGPVTVDEPAPEPMAEPEPVAEPFDPTVATEPEPIAEPEPVEQGPVTQDEVEQVETIDEVPASPAELDENEDPTVSLSGPGFAAPTVAVATEPLSIPEEPTSASSPPADAIFRQPSPVSAAEHTTVESFSEEERKLAAERAARREARAAALAAPAPEPVAAPKPVVIHKRTNDKFWGSLGLFLMRIVLAGIFTVRGLNILTDIPAAQAAFATTILADYPPGPQLVAIITGVASLLIALSLLLGLLTRVAGLGIALIAGGALALVYWGPWSIFQPGQPGFLGEYELLLAVTGLLLLCIGGGGWSLDRSFRAGRERDKRERAAEPQ